MLSAKDVSYIIKKNNESIGLDPITIPDIVKYCGIGIVDRDGVINDIPKILTIDNSDAIEGEYGFPVPDKIDDMDINKLRNIVKCLCYYVYGNKYNELKIHSESVLDIFPSAIGENRINTIEILDGSHIFKTGWESVEARLNIIESTLRDLKKET